MSAFFSVRTTDNYDAEYLKDMLKRNDVVMSAHTVESNSVRGGVCISGGNFRIELNDDLLNAIVALWHRAED